MQRTHFDTADDPLFRTVSRFPGIDEIENGDLYSLGLTNKTHGHTHGLHRFAAKFIPQVPAWAIEEFAVGADSVVLDPFCGSGTTLVETIQRCNYSVGVDCDPLAGLIANAKVARICASRLRELGSTTRRLIRSQTTED